MVSLCTFLQYRRFACACCLLSFCLYSVCVVFVRVCACVVARTSVYLFSLCVLESHYQKMNLCRKEFAYCVHLSRVYVHKERCRPHRYPVSAECKRGDQINSIRLKLRFTQVFYYTFKIFMATLTLTILNCAPHPTTFLPIFVLYLCLCVCVLQYRGGWWELSASIVTSRQ